MDGTAGIGSSVAGESTVIDLHGQCRPVVEGTAVIAGQVVCECTVADIGVCSCTIVADGTTAAGAAGIACRLGSAGFVLRENTVLNIQRIVAVTDGTAAACRIVVDEYDIPDSQHGIVVGIDGAAVSGSIAVLKRHTCQCHIHIVAGEFQNTFPVGSVSDLARDRIGGDCVAAVQNDVARTVVIQIAVDGDGGRCGDGDGFRDIDHITDIGPVKVRTVEDDEIIVGSIRCRRHCICEGGELVVCSIGSFRNGECYRFQRVRVILRGEGGFFDQSGPVFQIPVTVCSGGVGGCGNICAGEIGNVPDEGASFCIGSRVAAVDENIRIQRQVFPDPFPVCGIE